MIRGEIIFMTAYAYLKYFCKPLIFFPKLLKEGLKLSDLLLYFGVVIIYYDHYRFFKIIILFIVFT